MCKGNCGSCASCNADGAPQEYDPALIAQAINKYIYNGQAPKDELQEAYVKVMVWLEEKKLPFDAETINSNKEELKVVINDPNYLKDKEDEKPGWRLAAVIIVIILAFYWINKQQ